MDENQNPQTDGGMNSTEGQEEQNPNGAGENQTPSDESTTTTPESENSGM